MDIYEEYCIENGRASRDVAALRRKFNQLVNLPKPTGDPTCPPDVRRAKEISRAINESLEMAGLSDDDVLDLTEERVADAADDEPFETGSGNSSSGSSDTPRPSSVASTTPGNAREQALPARKKAKRDVTESLVSFLDVQRREAREQKIDVIMLYQSQIADLRQELRDSREECKALRDKLDELRHTSARERADLAAERDRALQKVMMFEMLQKK
ncbi:uncharacterized protein V1513DRAFT_402750 [Lipomyces chichibuensis]|uniref:uncharacterized protein n=1 Tax=Lipomyces chichibuensis TaxID=1546026 RepID=UPI00334430AB